MIKHLQINNNGVPLAQRDEYIYTYLKNLQKQKNQNLKILDVGGGSNARLTNTTHILDFLPLREQASGAQVEVFLGDMELIDTWYPIFDYVNKFGKFDFVVCSHTLEDLNCPQQVILNLFKVANAGMIALPTKYIETFKWETYYVAEPYMGYCHHRWIYTIKNGTLYGYPKMGSMEYSNFNFESSSEYRNRYGNAQTEMTFLWENDFSIKFPAPYQYYNHFEFTENKRSIMVDILEKDDVCKLLIP
jgi:hypothetical protein